MFTGGGFWLVLAATAAAYRLLPPRVRDGFLAAASFAYLASIDPTTITILLGWTLAFFYLLPHGAGGHGAAGGSLPGAPPGPSRRKPLDRRRLGSLLILAVLGYLAYHKYIPPLIASVADNPVDRHIVLPLGISYFTFKLIHYAVEVMRGNITERSLQRFACYVFLFPIFTAGPIERFDHFLAEREEPSTRAWIEGAHRILHGLIKRFALMPFIASTKAGTQLGIDLLLLRLDVMPTYRVWGFLVLSFLYLYLDFSAYSDIAIGGARLFGFRIEENFNWPIAAVSIGDFWRRWHRTLAGWCQAQVYMPMIGLTRNPYVATYATFIVMGLWHAGSLHWVFWGLYHGTGVAVFVIWTRWKRRVRSNLLDGPAGTLLARAMTLAFVAASGCFSGLYGHAPVSESFRVLAKLAFLSLPAPS